MRSAVNRNKRDRGSGLQAWETDSAAAGEHAGFCKKGLATNFTNYTKEIRGIRVIRGRAFLGLMQPVAL